jgi:hypothetical protein
LPAEYIFTDFKEARIKKPKKWFSLNNPISRPSKKSRDYKRDFFCPWGYRPGSAVPACGGDKNPDIYTRPRLFPLSIFYSRRFRSCHAGLDPASRIYFNGVEEVWMPACASMTLVGSFLISGCAWFLPEAGATLRLRQIWIPACAGMTGCGAAMELQGECLNCQMFGQVLSATKSRL